MSIQLEQAIGDVDVDLALLIVSNLSKGHGLKYKILMKSPRVLWLSSGHPLNRLPEISLQDLKSETFVQFVSDEAITSARKYLTNIGFKQKVILKTTSMEAVRGMVATGAAVTILASLVYRPWSLDGGRVELRSLKESIPSLDLGVAWRADKVLSEAETKFLDYLRSEGTLPTA